MEAEIADLVLAVKILVWYHVGQISVYQCTKCQAVTPAATEVCYVNPLQ